MWWEGVRQTQGPGWKGPFLGELGSQPGRLQRPSPSSQQFESGLGARGDLGQPPCGAPQPRLHCCLPTPSHTGDCHPVQPGELGALQCKAFGILVTVSFFFFKKKLFTYLTATGLHCGCRFFSCGMQLLGCSMWNLVPWPGIELRPPALRAWSLSHWTTRKVP